MKSLVLTLLTVCLLIVSALSASSTAAAPGQQKAASTTTTSTPVKASTTASNPIGPIAQHHPATGSSTLGGASISTKSPSGSGSSTPSGAATLGINKVFLSLITVGTVLGLFVVGRP